MLKTFRFIKEFIDHKLIEPIQNKNIKLKYNSTKEGSKKNLLYLSNKNIKKKKINDVEPNGDR